jgi:hypothetical protein
MKASASATVGAPAEGAAAGVFWAAAGNENNCRKIVALKSALQIRLQGMNPSAGKQLRLFVPAIYRNRFTTIQTANPRKKASPKIRTGLER